MRRPHSKIDSVQEDISSKALDERSTSVRNYNVGSANETSVMSRMLARARSIQGADSPAFTGSPTTTTPPADNNSTRIATTAYVIGQAGTSTPNMDGTGAAGSSTRWSPQDHTHPTDTSRAASGHNHDSAYAATGHNHNGTYARLVSVPSTATSTGSVGDYAADSSYLYICTATDTWRRVAIASW